MTVIASIFGVTLRLEILADEQYSWLSYAALGGMVLITNALLDYFRVRRWL